LLMLNPSATNADYYTNADPRFRDALRSTLRQDGSEKICLAINPQLWGSSWFCYYEKVLRPALSEYAKTAGTYLEALKELSRRLAILELVPYYAARASNVIKRKGLQSEQGLQSAKKARRAAADLQKRAENDDATVIAIFDLAVWDLGDAKGIVRNPGTATVNSEAQEEILKRLKRRK